MASIWAAPLVLAATWCAPAWAEELPGAVRFRERVQPILETYCYGCHGLGAKEGNRTLDEFASDEAMLKDVNLWWAVLKNLRAGVMPPIPTERRGRLPKKLVPQSEDVVVDARGYIYISDKNHGVYIVKASDAVMQGRA